MSKINYEYKIKGWVARDCHGRVYLFKDKPIRKDGNWESCLEFYHLLRSDFPEITWSNNPIEVELTIKKYEQTTPLFKNQTRILQGYRKRN